ncbi:MAG: nucleotidyltransferase family protein [Clostridia bacterium]|nr:nucleotidyltransferase family protein [Clostridia bacterium]
MFSLLSFEVFGKEIPDEIKSEITPAGLPDLYKLSKKHDIAHLISDALAKSGNCFEYDQYYQQFQSQQLSAFYRHEMQKYEFDRIRELFEENEIEFVPLKGSVIMDYYPEPWMRTRCDIDILVKKENIEKASSLLTSKLHYSGGKVSTHDVTFFSSNKVCLELHFDLNESDFKVFEQLSTPWDNTHVKESKRYEYELNEDYFIYYHIVHMAKHFAIGGCGIKPLIDLYLFEKILGYDKNAVYKLCKSCGLDKFYEKMLELQEVWFDGAAHNEMTLNLQKFILTGGVYGNYANRIAVKQTKAGGKVGFILSRIFLPLSELRRVCGNPNITVLQYPIYTIKRCLGLLKKEKRNKVVNELNTSEAVADGESKTVESMLESIGLLK